MKHYDLRPNLVRLLGAANLDPHQDVAMAAEPTLRGIDLTRANSHPEFTMGDLHPIMLEEQYEIGVRGTEQAELERKVALVHSSVIGHGESGNADDFWDLGGVFFDFQEEAESSLRRDNRPSKVTIAVTCWGSRNANFVS